MAISVSAVQDMARKARGYRRPKHTWNIAHVPWAITPCMIAPVLPGETLRNMVFQTRSVSDPIKSGIMGWWLEYYFFYVKLSDLDERDKFTEMVIDPEWTVAGQGVGSATARTSMMFNGRGQINWVEKCLKRVVEEYFRNEGEAWDAWGVNGAVPGAVDATTWLPFASLNTPHWTDSLILASEYTADDVGIVVGADDTVTAGEIDKAMQLYEMLKANQMVDMTYEAYLRTFGIRGGPAAEAEDPHIPELIRYVREWQYPSNAVLGDGSINTAVSWALSERADKDRFFNEPGFVFGVSVARPKVTFANVAAAGVSLLDRIQTWLPAVLWDDPFTSLVEKAAAAGPLHSAPAAYMVDVRDLFIHGDQFHSLVGAGTSSNFNHIPQPDAATLLHRYPGQTDIDQCFPAAAANKFVRQDGVCDLTIATHVGKDHTAPTARA